MLAFFVFGVIYTSCKKETECTAVITVKRQDDTLYLVSGALVKIYKYHVYKEGYSNSNGQVTKTFDLEAILDVSAEYITSPVDTVTPADTLIGKTVIRLLPGKTVYKTVFVN